MNGDLERTGRTIGRADLMIASVAIVRSVVLVTGNTAHYQNIIDLGYELELENWRIPASPDERALAPSRRSEARGMPPTGPRRGGVNRALRHRERAASVARPRVSPCA